MIREITYCASADGRLAMFDCMREGNYELYYTDLETLAVTRLASTPTLDGDPDWLP
jgi:Tol biopolymer transport system component